MKSVNEILMLIDANLSIFCHYYCFFFTGFRNLPEDEDERNYEGGGGFRADSRSRNNNNNNNSRTMLRPHSPRSRFEPSLANPSSSSSSSGWRDTEDVDAMIADLKKKTSGRDMRQVLQEIESGREDGGRYFANLQPPLVSKIY